MKFYSVKFVITMILIAISVVFVFMNKATAQQWFEFAQWTLSIYVLGNVGSKVAKNPVLDKVIKKK